MWHDLLETLYIQKNSVHFKSKTFCLIEIRKIPEMCGPLLISQNRIKTLIKMKIE